MIDLRKVKLRARVEIAIADIAPLISMPEGGEVSVELELYEPEIEGRAKRPPERRKVTGAVLRRGDRLAFYETIEESQLPQRPAQGAGPVARQKGAVGAPPARTTDPAAIAPVVPAAVAPEPATRNDLPTPTPGDAPTS